LDSCIAIATDEDFSNHIASSTKVLLTPEETACFFPYFKQVIKHYNLGDIELNSPLCNAILQDALIDFFDLDEDEFSEDDQLIGFFDINHVTDKVCFEDDFDSRVDLAEGESLLSWRSDKPWYINGTKPYDTIPPTMFGGVYQTMIPLPGGVRTRGRIRRKPANAGGARRRQRQPISQLVQLGQINQHVRVDPPITTTLRYNGVLTTDGAGTLSARFSLRNPLQAFNGSGSYVNATDYASIYDMYRVDRFTIQMEPLPTGPVKGGFVIAADFDANNSTAVPNYANILNYAKYATGNIGLQAQFSTRVPKLMSSVDTSTDPPTTITVHQGGWMDAATPAAVGHVYIGGINLGASVSLCTFVLTMTIKWKFRR
jgi:hypothetical protein